MAASFDAQKLDAVEAALANMESDLSIERRLVKEYKVTPKRVRTWIAEVRRRWVERDAAMTLDDRRAFIVAHTLHLLGQAKRDGSKSLVRELLRDLGKLWNVSPAEVSAVVNNFYDQRGLMRSPEMITSRLKELRALQPDDDEGDGGSQN